MCTVGSSHCFLDIKFLFLNFQVRGFPYGSAINFTSLAREFELRNGKSKFLFVHSKLRFILLLLKKISLLQRELFSIRDQYISQRDRTVL